VILWLMVDQKQYELVLRDRSAEPGTPEQPDFEGVDR